MRQAIILVASFVVVIFFLVYAIVDGLMYHSRVSAYAEFFGGVVTRSIQVDRLGEMGLSDTHGAAFQHSVYPQDWLDAFEGLSRKQLTRRDLDCSLGFPLSELDLTINDPVISVLILDRPLLYVVFFYGDVPSIESTFGSDLSQNLNAVPYYRPPKRGDLRLDSRHSSLEGARAIVFQAHRRGITWSSNRCQGYSYIVFEEKKNGWFR